MQTCFETYVSYVCLQMAQLGIHPWCSFFPPVVSRCERQCSRSRRAAWEIQVSWVRWGQVSIQRYEDVMEICRHGMFLDILLKLIHGSFCFQMLSQVENPVSVQLCWGPYSLCPHWVPAGWRGFQCLQVHKLTTVHDPNLEALYRLVGVAGLANQSWTPNTIDTIVLSSSNYDLMTDVIRFRTWDWLLRKGPPGDKASSCHTFLTISH